MSKWDVWFLLLLPFFSLLLPDVEAPTSCVLEAGVREEVRGGELELWMEDEKPEALLWGACSSAFLLTPVRWPPATDPIIAHSFVWSTETTTEEIEAEDEDEDDGVGSRTSMSSWAANFSSKLWMQLWLTGVSVCWRQFKRANHAKINMRDFSFFSCTRKAFLCLCLTLLSSFVMARESAGSDRLRSERYANSLFSSSGSGGFSVSSWDGTVADGAGLSLLTVEPSVRIPLSVQIKIMKGDLLDSF